MSLTEISRINILTPTIGEKSAKSLGLLQKMQRRSSRTRAQRAGPKQRLYENRSDRYHRWSHSEAIQAIATIVAII